MTDNPPPDGSPQDETRDMRSEPPASGEQYPGPPAEPWPPQPSTRRGRLRGYAQRFRGNRIALIVVGVLIAAGLVVGGVAIGRDGHDGGGRDGRGTTSQRDGGFGGNGDDREGGRRDRGRNGDSANGNRGNRGNNGTGGNGGGNAGSGTRQQVLGTVTAISSTSITIRTSGGNPTYPVTANTPVVRGGSAASVTDLKVGDAVVVRVVIASAGAAPIVAGISAG